MSPLLPALLIGLEADGPVTGVRNDDAAVIEAAALQFFSAKEEAWQTGEWRQGATVLLWSQLRTKLRPSAPELLGEWIRTGASYESDPKYGARIRRDLAPLRAVARELAAPASGFAPPEIVPFARMAFDPRIAVGEPKAREAWAMWWERPLPDGRPGRPRAILHATPPAYSGDGAIAIVAFEAPWSIHSADVLMGFRREGAGWRRLFARSRFYP